MTKVHNKMATTSGEEKQRERTERITLLDSTDEAKPRIRSPKEIIAKYKKVKDATSVAAYARNKLVQRHEKLEKVSKQTEELDSRAEDYSSLANELVKKMEKRRKWWRL